VGCLGRLLVRLAPQGHIVQPILGVEAALTSTSLGNGIRP
jgi:hypothetical protein